MKSSVSTHVAKVPPRVDTIQDARVIQSGNINASTVQTTRAIDYTNSVGF